MWDATIGSQRSHFTHLSLQQPMQEGVHVLGLVQEHQHSLAKGEKAAKAVKSVQQSCKERLERHSQHQKQIQDQQGSLISMRTT